MRSMSLLVIASALAACSTAPPPPMPPNPEAEARLQNLIAGKVAGSTVSCLPPRSGNNMVIIDDNTIAFEHGRTVYLNRLRGGGCSHLGSGFYALVTRSPTPNLCSGEIARVVNPTNGVFVGSCVLGEFIPYRRL